MCLCPVFDINVGEISPHKRTGKISHRREESAHALLQLELLLAYSRNANEAFNTW